MTEDQGAQKKTMQSEETVRGLYYSLMKLDPCFSFESLALQDYNHKASDDEPATVQDIEA